MKKLLALIVAALMMFSAVAALAEDFEVSQDYSSIPMEKTGDYDASGDPAAELIFTSVSVTGDSHTTAMSAFADAVKEFSGGTVDCKTYADGTLFSSEVEWDAISSGQADLAYISFPTLSTQDGLEWCAMVNSGYFWSSYEHMTTTLNGSEIGDKIFAEIEEKTNVVPLGAYYLGSRVVNTRAKAINSYDDMAGLLLRMPGSEAWQNLGAALGANPTPLSFSEEVAPYIAITNHVVDSIIPCINKDKWNSLTDAQKAAVKDAIAYAAKVNDTLRIASEDAAIAYLEGKGCTVTYPDLEDFRAHVQQYYADHPEQTETWNMELYEEIQALAK